MKKNILIFLVILISLVSCDKDFISENTFEYDQLIKRYITQFDQTDTIYYYYSSSKELIKKVEYRFDAYYDSIVVIVDKSENYYRIGEETFYFNDENKIVRRSSIGNTEEYEYNESGQLEKITRGDAYLSKYIYEDDVLQHDTTRYKIDNGYVTQITYYQFCDTLRSELGFDNIGLMNYGLNTEKLIKTQTIIFQDSLGNINNGWRYEMEYVISENSFQIDYKTFFNGKEEEQFRMRQLTKRIKK